jgi:hypothetical protein
VNREALQRKFPNASESFLAANSVPAVRAVSGAEPQPTLRDDVLAATPRETGNPGRVHVRIISRRRRLIDPDNLTPKFFIDWLRRSGLIRDDSSKEITLEMRQEKAERGDEGTLIEIYGSKNEIENP